MADEGYGSAGGSLESLVTVEPFKDEKAAASQQLAECGLVEDVEAIYPCSPMQEGILLSQARTLDIMIFVCSRKLLARLTWSGCSIAGII